MSRFFIARHGETVFNAARRMQGEAEHTPLTRAGFARAEAIGAALKSHIGLRPALALWASPTGRALQTLAIAVERIGLDWHAARTDARLSEMDMGGCMHGISSRVLRGLLTGASDRPECGAPVADPLPQGPVVCIEAGVETIVGLGSGDLGASGTA